MRILSVNVGKTREIAIKNRTIETGIYKLPVKTPVRVSLYGLQDDVMIEERKMGRENNAVYAYPYEHYAYWQQELARQEPFPMGQFGENLTITGLLETEVRIGDIFRFGNTVLQVAHHRIPCHKLNERMGLRFAPMFLASLRVGYYFRVLEEGTVTEGDSIELLERDEKSPTMEEFVRVLHYEYWDAEALQHLLQARDLMPAWQETLATKLRQATDAHGWHGLRELEVVEVEKENDRTVSLYLRCAKGKPLSTFHGGQQIMVALGERGGGSQQRGAYYLSGKPADTGCYRMTFTHDWADEREGVVSVSAHLFNLEAGELIRCNAPHGAVRSMPEEVLEVRLPVLVSEGLGIAPMLSRLYELEAQGFPAVIVHQPTDEEPGLLLEEARALVSRNNNFRWVDIPDSDAEIVTGRLLNDAVDLAHSNIDVAASKEFIARLEIELMTFNISPAALFTHRLA